MAEHVEVEPRAVLPGQLVYLPAALQHLPVVLAADGWVLPLRLLQPRDLSREEPLLLEALAAQSKAELLEAALHGRGAPGGAGRGPQQQPRRVLLDEAAGDLQGAVVEVDDALDLLPLGQLDGEDPAAVVEVGEGGGDGEQLVRPGAGVPGQLQQVAELRVADEAEDLLIRLLADQLPP